MNVSTVIAGIVAGFASLAFHETGHLVTGLLVGFDFSLFAIGPFLIERTPAGAIRIGWNRTAAFAGGVAATLPTRDENLRARFALVVAGGPFFSLLLAVAAAAALPSLSHAAPFLKVIVSWFRLLSALVFVATSLPVRNGAFANDGLRFVRLMRSGPHGDRELAMLTLVCLQMSGVRPRDWNEMLIERSLAIRDASMFECQMHLYSYHHALDAGTLTDAESSLDRALALASRVPVSLKAECHLEAAYFEAVHRGRSAKARSLLTDVPARAYGVADSDRLRALGAVALCDHDFRSAESLLTQALACCPSWASGPRAWITRLLESIPGREGTACPMEGESALFAGKSI